MTQAFYSAWIKRKKSLGSAFVEARTALTDDATSLDWASLQLYSRGTHSLMQPTPEPARRLETRATRARLLWIPGVAVALGLGWFVATHSLGNGEVQGSEAIAGKASSAVEPLEQVSTSGSSAPTFGSTGPTSGSTGSTSETVHTASAKLDTPSESTTTAKRLAKKKLAPLPVKQPKKPVHCPSKVKAYLRAVLPPRGASVVRLTISVAESGAVSVRGGDATTRASAKARLGEASGLAAKLVRAAGDKVPCVYNGFDW